MRRGLTIRAVIRRAALFAGCLALAALLPAAPREAGAHAKLLRSEPRPKSRLARPPAAVELWFSEELQPGFNAVEVKGAGGQRFDRGEPAIEEGGKKLRAELRELPAGAYTVEWKALSADQHPLKGTFTFNVEAAATAPAAESATPPPASPAAGQQSPPGLHDRTHSEDAAGEQASGVGVADRLVRWVGYLAMMALAGGFAAWLFVLGPALRALHDEGVGAEGVDGAAGVASRRSLTIFRLSAATLLLSTLLALVFQSAAVYGVGPGGALAPSRLAGVVAATGYGKSWLVQAAGAAAVLLVVLALGRAAGRNLSGGRERLLIAGLAASGLLVLGPGLTGHAAVAAKQFPLAALSDWLHLAAGAFWVGGLFHLALALPPALSRLPPGPSADALGRAIQLFTRVAVPAVVLVLLAGLYNSWLHLGGWAALWGTPYGRTLLVKLLLVLAMLALGALNNFHFGRRLRRRPAANDETADADAGRGFARSLRLEAALGVLVLLASAFLVFTTPGRG